MSGDDGKPPASSPNPVSPDPADDQRLLDVAGEILDGDEIDWDTAAHGAAEAYLDELRAIGAVAHLSTRRHSAIGRWGPLDLLECVAEGAFGEVFRAWDPRLDREVALKLLRPGTTPHNRRTTVIAEGRLLARVRHPNVVTVFGAEEIDGRVGIWTEFVHGETIAHRIEARGPLAAGEAVAIGGTLCGALATVHAAGVVHGDVKAQNVIVQPDGRIVLVDLGTGHELSLEAPVARTRRISGTPLYMAPELWTFHPHTPQSDIYSLGVLLYFLVTGSFPVRGETADAVREAHAAGRRVPIAAAAPNLPLAFVAAVERALSRSASDRFASAGEFRAALEAADPANVRRRRRRAVVVAVASAGIALVAAAAWSVGTLWPRNNADTTPRLSEDQRTFAPPEGQVGAAAISPDGSLLAYAHAGGLTVQNVAMRESSDIELPATLSGIVDLAWIANRTLVVATPRAVWRVPTDRSAAASIADFGGQIAVSPNGRYVAVQHQIGGAGRLVVLPTDGSAAAPVEVVPISEGVRIARPSWSPDGSRISYGKTTMSGKTSRVIASRPSAGGPETTVLEPSSLFHHVWAADGRILFAISQPPPNGRYHDLYSVAVDTATGERQGPAVPIVTGRAIRFDRPSLTRDGRVLAFTSNPSRSEVYVAPFDPDRRVMGTPERLSLTSTFDAPVGWSPAGTDVVFRTEGTNGYVMYVQPLDRRQPRLLLPPDLPIVDASVTSDGRSIVYITPDSVMRVSVSGGPPVALFDRPVNATLRCPRASSPSPGRCVAVSRPPGEPTMGIVSFDPAQGQPRQHLRLPVSDWDLSPDGRHVVAIDSTRPVSELVVLDLGTETLRRIAAPNLASTHFVSWVDQRGWIVTRPHGTAGTEIVRVDPDGRSAVIWQHRTLRLSRPFLSPDGRRIAFSRVYVDGNVWLLRGL